GGSVRPRRSRPHVAWSPARCLFGAAVALALSAAAAPGRAADTQWWVTDHPEDYANGEAHGLVIRPDGALELGPAARFLAADSLRVVWPVAPLKDGSVALAGDRGMVLRYSERGGFSVLARQGHRTVLQ